MPGFLILLLSLLGFFSLLYIVQTYRMLQSRSFGGISEFFKVAPLSIIVKFFLRMIVLAPYMFIRSFTSNPIDFNKMSFWTDFSKL